MPSTTTIFAGGPRHALTVRHLRIEGDDREIGRCLAEAGEAAHGAAAVPRRAADPALERIRRRWFARNHRVLAERGRGVADHFGLDPDDPSVSLDWMGTYDLPAGCSVAFHPSEVTKEGHGLLARNFDFPTATFTQLVGLPPLPSERPLASDPWIVELRPERGYASVVVGIMDLMGGMDGINEAGLAVALLADNETPDPEPTGTPAVGLSEQQVVRFLLDTCATVDEAMEALLLAKHYYFFTPCHYMVCDRSGRSFVWEHSRRRNREIIVGAEPGEPLVCTNHLLHRWPDPAQLPADDGPMGTAARTYERWRTLTAPRSGALVDRDEIRSRFDSVRFEAPLVEARTFWHALYDVDDASVELSFFLHDQDGESIYSEPVRLGTGP